MVNNEQNQTDAGTTGGSAVKAGWSGLPTSTKVLLGALLAVVGMALLRFLS